MTSEDHLQISDILAYHERRLSVDDHTMAARHLLRCAGCRNRLPLPTADEFWRAVMGDDDEALNATGIGSAWSSAKDFLAGALSGQRQIRNAVLASFLAVAVLGFSFFLILPGSENGKQVAALGDSEPKDIPTNHDSAEQDPGRRPNTDIDSSVSASDSRTTSAAPRDRVSSLRDRERDIRTPQRTNKRLISQADPRQKAETRGSVPCEGQRFLSLEAKQTDAGLLLTWERVTGAVEYNIYLSDLDERLADHFATADQTTYLVKAELDANKIYRLRLIATIEDGKRIVSEPQTFKVSDLKNGLQSRGSAVVRKKTTASVRCLEVKQ